MEEDRCLHRSGVLPLALLPRLCPHCTWTGLGNGDQKVCTVAAKVLGLLLKGESMQAAPVEGKKVGIMT